jgi:hypothetical protein
VGDTVDVTFPSKGVDVSVEGAVVGAGMAFRREGALVVDVATTDGASVDGTRATEGALVSSATAEGAAEGANGSATPGNSEFIMEGAVVSLMSPTCFFTISRGSASAATTHRSTKASDKTSFGNIIVKNLERGFEAVRNLLLRSVCEKECVDVDGGMFLVGGSSSVLFSCEI